MSVLPSPDEGQSVRVKGTVWTGVIMGAYDKVPRLQMIDFSESRPELGGRLRGFGWEHLERLGPLPINL